MIAGAALVAVCLFVLGWTSEILRLFLGGSSEGVEREKEEERLRRWTAALAVLDIFVLDFVLNIAQTTCHALVVDTLPVAKQQLGAAWGEFAPLSLTIVLPWTARCRMGLWKTCLYRVATTN